MKKFRRVIDFIKKNLFIIVYALFVFLVIIFTISVLVTDMFFWFHAGLYNIATHSTDVDLLNNTIICLYIFFILLIIFIFSILILSLKLVSLCREISRRINDKSAKESFKGSTIDSPVAAAKKDNQQRKNTDEK